MTVQHDHVHHSDFEVSHYRFFSRRHLCFWFARGPSSPSVRQTERPPRAKLKNPDAFQRRGKMTSGPA